jgi:CrcB protein
MIECLIYARTAKPGLLVGYLAATLIGGFALVWAGARLADFIRPA